MCMLTFYRPGALPDTEKLTNGARFNDDGHGFAIVAGDRLIIRHGLSAAWTIAEFARIRDKYPDGPALFHSRLGTGGTADMRNCHPFRVGGDRKTLIAHNGILPDNVQPGKGEKRCDTRIFAEDVMHGADLSNPGVRKYYTEWMGKWNKIVILSVNPAYPEQSWILNEEQGNWDGDTWYSNWDHEPYYSRWEPKNRPWWADYECPICFKIDEVDWKANICLRCNYCLDCQEDLDDCQCYLDWRADPDENPVDPEDEAALVAEEMEQERRQWWEDQAEALDAIDEAARRDAIKQVLDRGGTWRQHVEPPAMDVRVRPSLL